MFISRPMEATQRSAICYTCISRPTKRALDAGDSAAFSSIFLALSFFCSQALSTPAPAPVTQTVGWLRFYNQQR